MGTGYVLELSFTDDEIVSLRLWLTGMSLTYKDSIQINTSVTNAHPSVFQIL